MRSLYRRVRRAAGIRLFPSIYIYKNPFRILEYRELMRETTFSGDEHVLDLGCGAGIQTCCLARNASKATGLDICDLGVAEENRRRVEGRLDVEFINRRLQEAGFADGDFDKIISICVLEHMPDYRQVIEKCHDLLKDAGEIVFSVDTLATIPADIRERHQHDHSVVHYFKPDELASLLRDCGFHDIHVRPILCSRKAARMFISGINKGYAYSPGWALLKYAELWVSERLNRKRDEGVFLVASCRK